MSDIVIREISEFFQELNFMKVNINGKVVFEHKNGFYMLTKGGTHSYFLEYARTFQEAHNNCYEDVEAYSIKATSEDEIIRIIKCDIEKCILDD
ncbi:hypothetical protein GC097_20275 [Paenibacillus sp. LMG 31457]|uniref:Uncharacterized protein n=2 Tax=Paenibacillus planticolens TaxID=2654976 RepID=A0ABX1ZRJ4_9BACL|nr:hypothetical protein [Paenibacillus planticolens]